MTVLRPSRPVTLFALLLVAFAPTSCTRAPSVDVMGSFFPAWLVCFTAAVALTALARMLLMRFNMKMQFPIIVYPSLVACFTFALWLMFFY